MFTKFKFKSLEPPTVIRCIGDSHASQWDNLLFTRDDRLYKTFIYTRFDLYYVAMRAREVADQDGVLSYGLTNYLINERMVSRVEPTKSLDRRNDHGPVLVVSCGDGDLRGDFLRKPIDESALASAHVKRAIERTFAPLHKGLKIIREATNGQIFLTAIPPPTADDARFEQIHGFRTKAVYRTQAAKLFNEINAAMCARSGTIFVDLWETFIEGPGISERFSADGTHLTAEGSRMILAAIIAQLS